MDEEVIQEEVIEETVEETVEEEVVEDSAQNDDVIMNEDIVAEEVTEEVIEDEATEEAVSAEEEVGAEEVVGGEEEVQNEDNLDQSIHESIASEVQLGTADQNNEPSETIGNNETINNDSDSDSDNENDHNDLKKPDLNSDTDSDDDQPKEIVASDDEEPVGKTGLESSDEEDDEKQEKETKEGDKKSDSDDSDDNVPTKTGIFDDSDNDVPTTKPVDENQEAATIQSSDDDRPIEQSQMSDFDLMMSKRKEENRQKRLKGKKSDSTFIGDADDSINSMLNRMKEAADNDKNSNRARQPAVAKIKMLKEVLKNVSKHDLNEVLVENGLMSALADWLSPLPDRSLPSLNLRTEILKKLKLFTGISSETLKHSGIGKSVMFLYKHPRESRGNKEICRDLISRWSSGVYNRNDSFSAMSREAREQRDFDLLPKAKKRRLKEAADGKHIEKKEETEQNKPGRKGFVMRARVPMPSNQDYVVRPKWNVDGADSSDDEEASSSRKKRRPRNQVKKKSEAEERLERQMKRQIDLKRSKRVSKAATVNLQKITL